MEKPDGGLRLALDNQAGWELNWYPKLSDALSRWEQLTPTANLFLRTDFLEFLDQHPLLGVNTSLAICHNEYGDAFGWIVQDYHFKPFEQIGGLQAPEALAWWQRLGRKLNGLLRFRVLVAGQLLLTGQNGLRAPAEMSLEERAALIAEAMEKLARRYPRRIDAILLKDLALDNLPIQHGFHSLPVQPDMLLTISPRWQSMDDYLDELVSKYRVRYRRARAKAEGLTRRELSLSELRRERERMYELYQQVITGADYSAFTLPPDYFFALKRRLPEQVTVWAYYDGDQMVGFFSAIRNGEELEAHFLGFDQQVNRLTQLYLNMLYDMIEEGIQNDMRQVHFARTALEIKSSVGAEPTDFACWLKVRYSLLNPFVSRVAHRLSPLPEWQPRRPWK